MKCEKCNKEHLGPWPFGYTHVYCECGHEWEVANLPIEPLKRQIDDMEQRIRDDLQAAISAYIKAEIEHVLSGLSQYKTPPKNDRQTI